MRVLRSNEGQLDAARVRMTPGKDWVSKKHCYVFVNDPWELPKDPENDPMNM